MRLAVVVVLTLLLAACGSSASDEEAEPRSAPSSSSSSSSPTPTEAPWQTLKSPLARCGPQPAALGDVRFGYQVLTDPAVGRIPAAMIGSGRTVAVLLHQTDGNGLCGWLEYAARIGAQRGLTALAIDLCQYGDARCRTGLPQTDPVELAVRHAREDLHARRSSWSARPWAERSR